MAIDFIGLAALITSMTTAVVSIGTFLRAGYIHEKVDRVQDKAEIITKKAVAIQNDVHLLEVNTNSIKDALLKATAEASHAEGVQAGIRQERADPQESKKKPHK